MSKIKLIIQKTRLHHMFVFLLLVGVHGCSGSESTNPVTPTEPPVISEDSLVVECELDLYYGFEDYHWYFAASVDDPDGYEDVEFVKVNITDSSSVLNSLELYNIDRNLWDAGYFENEENLNILCNQKENYTFEFVATDFSGSMGKATKTLSEQ